MKKIWIISSVIIITSTFIYSMIYLSELNKCSWVRSYECQKEENKNLVLSEKYIELKQTWDLFLKDCIPKIKELENEYLIDYTSCSLKVSISKEKPWVNQVDINWNKLKREDIDNHF